MRSLATLLVAASAAAIFPADAFAPPSAARILPARSRASTSGRSAVPVPVDALGFDPTSFLISAATSSLKGDPATGSFFELLEYTRLDLWLNFQLYLNALAEGDSDAVTITGLGGLALLFLLANNTDLARINFQGIREATGSTSWMSRPAFGKRRQPGLANRKLKAEARKRKAKRRNRSGINQLRLDPDLPYREQRALSARRRKAARRFIQTAKQNRIRFEKTAKIKTAASERQKRAEKNAERARQRRAEALFEESARLGRNAREVKRRSENAKAERRRLAQARARRRRLANKNYAGIEQVVDSVDQVVDDTRRAAILLEKKARAERLAYKTENKKKIERAKRAAAFYQKDLDRVEPKTKRRDGTFVGWNSSVSKSDSFLGGIQMDQKRSRRGSYARRNQGYKTKARSASVASRAKVVPSRGGGNRFLGWGGSGPARFGFNRNAFDKRQKQVVASINTFLKRNETPNQRFRKKQTRKNNDELDIKKKELDAFERKLAVQKTFWLL